MATAKCSLLLSLRFGIANGGCIVTRVRRGSVRVVGTIAEDGIYGAQNEFPIIRLIRP